MSSFLMNCLELCGKIWKRVHLVHLGYLRTLFLVFVIWESGELLSSGELYYVVHAGYHIQKNCRKFSLVDNYYSLHEMGLFRFFFSFILDQLTDYTEKFIGLIGQCGEHCKSRLGNIPRPPRGG